MTRLWTIGHSTRALDAFVAALQSFEIGTLVDVRRFPTSRRHPHFNTVDLKKSLFHAGRIDYVYLGDELGGMRKASQESRHRGLAGSGFHGYADWMEKSLFRRGTASLVATANTGATAVMCAERHPASCHRGLLSDFLTLVERVEVVHILDPGRSEPHLVSPTARREGEFVVYDRDLRGAPLESFG